MLGGIGGRRRKERPRMRWLDCIMDSMNSRSWCWTVRPGALQFMGSQPVGHEWVTVLNWTEDREIMKATVQPWNWKMLAPLKKSYDQPRQHIKKQRRYIANKGLSSQSYGFSSSHVCLWELDYKQSWALKNWCFWTAVLKTLESLLDYKKIQPVHPKGNQSWIFIGRTDAEAETPILWTPTNSLEKALMLGKIEGRRRGQ